MIAADCPEDLLVLARRRALSASERRLLEDHAVDCGLCRMAISIGAALAPLSQDDVSERGDDALAARLIAGALAPRPAAAGRSSPPPRTTADDKRIKTRARRPSRWAVAAALILMGGSASAALWRWSSWRPAWLMGPRPSTPAPNRPAGARHAGPTRRQTLAPAPGDEPTPALAAAPPAPAVAPRPATPIPGTSSAPVAVARRTTASLANDLVKPAARDDARSDRPIAAESAAALFRAANEARRARQLSEAQRLYRALQSRFPGSPEAALSFLSLGDLCLARGALSEALQQFDDYLASGDAALVEEALVGRARTLARLGRTADERAAWKQLLARYPESDYRWRAQQRLDGDD